MYYQYHPYYVNAQHYPLWVAVNQPSHTPLPQPTATPPTNSPFPAVDTEKLKNSAKTMPSIMQQAQLLTTKISGSDQFSHDLMSAAQLSNNTEVDRLIKSIGVNVEFKATFTPSGLEVRFYEAGCCSLTVNLGW